LFSNKLIDVIKDLKTPEILLYITLEVIFIAFYTWSIIGIKDAGHGIWLIMVASGFRNIIAAIILFLTTKKISDILSDKLLIKILALLSGISILILVFYGYEGGNTLALLAIVSLAHSAVFSLRLFGTSIIFPKVQSGNGKNAKLAILLIMAPIILATVTSITGFLASFNIMLPIVFSAIICFALLLLPKYKNIINSIEHKVPIHELTRPCKRCIALFIFSSISNAISLIIKWVIIPLYLWDEFGHDPKKLGLALSLIILAGLVGKSIKDEAKAKKFSSHSFLMFGHFLNIISLVIWSSTENLAIIGLMIALRTIASSIYTYGYSIKLESVNPNNYKKNIRIHMVISYGLTGIAFFIAAFWAEYIMNNLSMALLTSAFIMLIIAICYQIFCWKFENIVIADKIGKEQG